MIEEKEIKKLFKRLTKCGCGGSFKRVHRQYRDWDNRLQWGWFIECDTCHHAVQHVTCGIMKKMLEEKEREKLRQRYPKPSFDMKFCPECLSTDLRQYGETKMDKNIALHFNVSEVIKQSICPDCGSIWE